MWQQRFCCKTLDLSVSVTKLYCWQFTSQYRSISRIYLSPHDKILGHIWTDGLQCLFFVPGTRHIRRSHISPEQLSSVLWPPCCWLEWAIPPPKLFRFDFVRVRLKAGDRTENKRQREENRSKEKVDAVLFLYIMPRLIINLQVRSKYHVHPVARPVISLRPGFRLIPRSIGLSS